MVITRKWAMPDKWTFEIWPIKELLSRYGVGRGWVDPFSGKSELAEYRNDLNLQNQKSQSHMKALDFLKTFNSIDSVVFDPPYTSRQVKECYEDYGYEFLLFPTCGCIV